MLEAVVERALPHWPIEVEAVTFVSARENVVYRVDTVDGCSYALRIHRPGYHTLAELESENDWTTALSDAGIGTPRPVPTAAGGGYATVPYGDGPETRHVGLIEWLEGEPLDEVLAAGERDPVPVFRALGELMARMHDQAIAWERPAKFARHALDADGLVGEDPWWGRFWEVPELTAGEREVVSSARRTIHGLLRGYGRRPARYSVIHSDLLAENVLVHDRGVAAIDFDDAAFGWHQYDLASGLTQHVRHPRYEDLRAALLAGYQDVRPLSEEDLALLPVFLLVRPLVEIGWFHERLGGPLTQRVGGPITREGTIVSRIRASIEQCAAVLPSMRSVV